MFPYHDENETQRTPYVTFAIIAANVLAWLLVQRAGSTEGVMASVCNLGLIPGEFTQSVPPGTPFQMGEGVACLTDPGRAPLHLLTSMFLHGSWMHLLGNMWFFWLFGNNIEDSMTRPRFVAFYLLCGLAAAFAQIYGEPASAIPMVGASGAISGVMGAYLILFPRVRVWTIVPLGIFIQQIPLPAWAMLIYWAFLQFAGGVTSVVSGEMGGVAFWAHVGGFAAGIILVKVFARPGHLAAHTAENWRPGWN